MKSNSQNLRMDTINAVRYYVDKIVADPSIGGMKALILDPITTQAISMVYSQTQILEKEVYLVELLGKKHEQMNHLKAAIFIQPTEININLLIKELKEPRFSEYHIFFSNIISEDLLNRLARGDEHEVVRQVQEYYSEFLAINEDFFHLGLEHSLILGPGMERNTQGILSFLLAMKRRPSQIRYQSASDYSRRVAESILTAIEADDVFDFRRSDGPLLLILDRRDDPVTPLLTQWTYQAMVHELLGIHNNRVVLRGAPGIRKDLEEVVISSTQDQFFAKHRYSNFGDLGTAVKSLLDEYQKNAKMNENITSIEDMQAFMERYPAFRSHSLVVSKHVAIMGELARLTDRYHLLDISALEQEIVCGNDSHSNHKHELMEKIMNPRIENADKLRLCLLYLIKYEQYQEIHELKHALTTAGGGGIDDKLLSHLDLMLQYAGETKRSVGLFSHGGLFHHFNKTLLSSVRGVENVYTQHVPALQYILESIAKNKIKESTFPSLISGGGGTSSTNEVIVFIVGGATYEEALTVSQFNNTNPTMRVMLGGSCVHNSLSFLDEIQAAFGR
jgi:vacuolar protein sorting-associated protein 45